MSNHKQRLVALAAKLTASEDALAQHEREAAQQVHMHTKSWSQDFHAIRDEYDTAIEALAEAADAALNDHVRYDHIIRWSGDRLRYDKDLAQFV
tara:strand:+ start:172 stop:453 length:282 start_codon:yes stop_codon:yes gene_type:complete